MTYYTKTLCWLLACTGILFSPAAFAQSPPTPKTIAELTALLKSEMEKQHVAGMMLTIVSKDSILYAGGIGFADVEKQSPVSYNHLFRQGSVTKLFTALGVLSLVQQGKLRLDDELRKLAPEVPFRNNWQDTNPVTVAQLLEHSTGFADKSPFEEFNYSGKGTSLQALQVYDKYLVTGWKPGERFAYSNVNYAVLAYLVEKLSGKSFQDYMQVHVFAPLGMPTANVKLTVDSSTFSSKGYVWQQNQFHEVPYLAQHSAGNGSLQASATDLAKALQAYLYDWQTPGGQFLSQELLLRSETPSTYLSAQAGLRNTYALGNESREINGRVFRGHSGTIAGFSSNFLYSRELGVGFAFSMNTLNESFFRYATNLIARFVTQHHPTPGEPKVFAKNEEVIKPYLGYHRLSNSNDFFTGYFQSLQHTFKLTQQQGNLRANLLLGGSMAWKAADDSSLLFRSEWATDPRILLLHNQEESPVIVEDTMYFEKVSAFKAWAPIVLLLLSLLFMVSALIYGVISLLQLPFRRQKSYRVLLIKLFPALSMMGLLLSLWALKELPAHVIAGAPIDMLTLSWHVGRYAFALLMLSTLVLLVTHWSYLQSNWLKGYLVVIALSGCHLFGVLVMSNWYTL